MATCAKCGSGKLSERPCPKCGSGPNAPLFSNPSPTAAGAPNVEVLEAALAAARAEVAKSEELSERRRVELVRLGDAWVADFEKHQIEMAEAQGIIGGLIEAAQGRTTLLEDIDGRLGAAPAPPAPTEASTVYVACYGIGWPEDGDAVLGAFPSEAAAKAALDAAGVHGWVTACVIGTSSAVITNG